MMLDATHSEKCLFSGMGGRRESEMAMQLLQLAFAVDKEELIRRRIINLPGQFLLTSSMERCMWSTAGL